MNDIYITFKNLTRNKLRFGLNCFCIFVAFFLFGMLSAFGGIFDAAVQFSEGRLMVVNKVNLMQPLPISHVNKIKGVDGVVDVTYMSWFAAYYQNETVPIKALVVEPESYLRIHPELILQDIDKNSWLRERRGIIVGENLAATKGWKLGDRIPISSPLFFKAEGGNTWELIVSGIFKGEDQRTDTNKFFLHYDYFNQGQAFTNNQVSIIILTTDENVDSDKVVGKIDNLFANSSAETSTSTEKQFTTSLIRQIADIGMILNVTISVAFFTILLVVGNMIAIAVRERTKEIAVLRVLGFSAMRIFNMILAESVLLAFIGGGLGLLVAYLALTKINSLPELKSMMPSMLLTVPMILQGVIFMLILGLVAGFLPALKAMKKNIVLALNGE